MKISLIHDWLRVNAGSEKVIREILSLYRNEDIELYTLFNKLSLPDGKDILQGKTCHTSLLHYVPWLDKIYKTLLPAMPFFIQSMHIRSSDLYLSSSHAIAKGFRLPPGKLHICYCHTPMRYAWYLYDDYLKDVGPFKKRLIEWIIPMIQRWDLRSAQQVDFFIANSKHISEQIRSIYGRDSVVIYPPVQTDQFKLNPNPRQDFYLAVGRFVPYKKMDTIIRAFLDMPERKLVLIGEGYDAGRSSKLIRQAKNIVWLGYQHDDELLLYMQNAKACIFAAKEDFGIMCVEAQSTGTPVLALDYGGYRETVQNGLSGYFFPEQTEASIREAVQRFEQSPLTDHMAIHRHAAQFSAERFRQEFSLFVREKMNERA